MTPEKNSGSTVATHPVNGRTRPLTRIAIAMPRSKPSATMDDHRKLRSVVSEITTDSTMRYSVMPSTIASSIHSASFSDDTTYRTESPYHSDADAETLESYISSINDQASLQETLGDNESISTLSLRWKQRKAEMKAQMRRDPSADLSESNTGWEDEEDDSLSTQSCDTFETDLSKKFSKTMRSGERPAMSRSYSSKVGSQAEPIDVTDCDSLADLERGSRLRNVEYVSQMDEASSHRQLSEVRPIGRQEARDAFGRSVPTRIAGGDRSRDEVSSFGKSKIQRILPSLWSAGMSKVSEERLPTTVPSSTSREASSTPYHKQEPTWNEYAHDLVHKMQSRRCLTPQTDLELFFVLLISVAVLTLIILLSMIVAK